MHLLHFDICSRNELVSPKLDIEFGQSFPEPAAGALNMGVINGGLGVSDLAQNFEAKSLLEWRLSQQ